MRKSFEKLSLDISEPEYRSLPYYSYSKIAKYARKGPKSLIDKEKEDSPSLLFGSIVDSLITDKANFNKNYVIMTNGDITDGIRPIIDYIVKSNSSGNTPLAKIDSLLSVIKLFGFGGNWKDETKLNKVIEGGETYYSYCIKNPNKIVISKKLYEEATNLCSEIIHGEWTKDIFKLRDLPDVEFLYQQKLVAPYKHTIDGSTSDFQTIVKAMLDLIIVNHSTKVIKLYDIKTTSSILHEFQDSFYKWKYQIQQYLYHWLVKEVISSDEYFKDFKVEMLEFIVASRYERKVQRFQDYHVAANTIIPYTYENWKIYLQEMYWHDYCKKYDYEYQVYQNNGLKLLYS